MDLIQTSDCDTIIFVAIRYITLEHAEQIAETLRDPNETLTSATVAAGLSPAVTRRLMHDFEAERCSENEYGIAMVIAQALQRQFVAHRAVGASESLYQNGVMSKWAMWRLETSAPREHAKITKTELTGADGGAIEFASLSLEQLLAMSAEEDT